MTLVVPKASTSLLSSKAQAQILLTSLIEILMKGDMLQIQVAHELEEPELIQKQFEQMRKIDQERKLLKVYQLKVIEQPRQQQE